MECHQPNQHQATSWSQSDYDHFGRMKPITMKFQLSKFLMKSLLFSEILKTLMTKKNELRKNRTREKRYAFDFAFDETTETDRVFQVTAMNLCGAVLEGFNSTVFAYGATGAGKTHTMLGNADKPGIMFQTMKELFRIKNQFTDRDYSLRISFLEI